MAPEAARRSLLVLLQVLGLALAQIVSPAPGSGVRGLGPGFRIPRSSQGLPLPDLHPLLTLPSARGSFGQSRGARPLRRGTNGGRLGTVKGGG